MGVCSCPICPPCLPSPPLGPGGALLVLPQPGPLHPGFQLISINFPESHCLRGLWVPAAGDARVPWTHGPHHSFQISAAGNSLLLAGLDAPICPLEE